MKKIEIFFELLSAVYGRAKIEAQWPTERDLQIVKALVKDKIESMSLTEIRAAIDNTRIMRSQEHRGWDWPDVDLILAGARRYATAAHRPFLPEPPRDIPPPHERSALMQKLRMEVGL